MAFIITTLKFVIVIIVILQIIIITQAISKPGFPPSQKPGCLPSDNQTNLFCPGQYAYGCYKIPSLLVVPDKNILISFIEARKYSCDDKGYVDLIYKRSMDNGKTWSDMKKLYGESTDENFVTIGDANPVYDKHTKTIFVIFARNNVDLYVTSSKDYGVTWDKPINITSSAKYGDYGGWAGTGHAGGIQLAESGRLVIPGYTSSTYVIYSDDHGSSWHVGGILDGGGEATVAEISNNVLLMNMRNNNQKKTGDYRLQSYSYDGGLSWNHTSINKDLIAPVDGCEGSLIKHPNGNLYFSNPTHWPLRYNLDIKKSTDNGQTWKHHHTVWKKSAGYSSMRVMPGTDEIGILYDRNNKTMIIFEAQSVSFTLIDP